VTGPGEPAGVASPELPGEYRCRFEELDPALIVRAFGVSYGHLSLPDGSDLYVTRHGWPFLGQLLPENWYADRAFAEEGRRLPGSTGHVYHVVTRGRGARPLSIVVKFSRVAQDVPIVIDETLPENVSASDFADARFNSPMEEFGLVEELRGRDFGPPEPRVIAQRPLAIYVPEERCARWQLGRSASQFGALSRLLVADQEDAVKAIELDIRRIYVLVYGWITGRDAEQWYDAGEIGHEEFHGLADRVAHELAERGFHVLDNKPKHFILRRGRRTGELLRDRRGRLVYGLVDFELLQRTADHQVAFQERQRRRYRGRRPSSTSLPVPPRLSGRIQTDIFGVRYSYGALADGGRLWVVGDDPELFDYFVPERWRRTPRVQLALSNEVYRTRTRDGIEVVYRRSRVGMRPRVDPLRPEAPVIRSHGYNSPFEEIAVADRLRQMGVRTTRPRAVLRTGHESQKAVQLRDERCFRDHAEMRTPDASREPILRPLFDYYSIWDCFRGEAPPTAPESEALALSRARRDRPLAGSEWDDTLARARERMEAIGLPGLGLEEELSVFVDENGDLVRDEEGRLELAFTLDGLTAHEFGIIDGNRYRETIAHTGEKLRAADFEALNLHGRHLLLTLDPDGRVRADSEGHPLATLCNFEMVRGLYRPIR
jgi:hypothetical protein